MWKDIKQKCCHLKILWLLTWFKPNGWWELQETVTDIQLCLSCSAISFVNPNSQLYWKQLAHKTFSPAKFRNVKVMSTPDVKKCNVFSITLPHNYVFLQWKVKNTFFIYVNKKVSTGHVDRKPLSMEFNNLFFISAFKVLNACVVNWPRKLGYIDYMN